MKKILFMMAVCLMSMQITPNKCLASSNQNDSIIGVDILLLQYIDKGSMGEDPNRSPSFEPSAFLMNKTIQFSKNCIGLSALILQDETVVYSSFVDEDGIVLLPATLTGECELRLYWGSIVFIGEFNL